MRKFYRINFALPAALALTFSSFAAIAHEYAKADLLIEHPWARPTLSASVPAAVYFEIVNSGDVDDKLIAASSARAEHIELHKTEMNAQNIAKMSMVKDGIAAPADATTSMETGAYHVMLIGLANPLKAGEEFPMTLTFERAGDIEVIIKVEDREKSNSGHDHH